MIEHGYFQKPSLLRCHLATAHADRGTGCLPGLEVAQDFLFLRFINDGPQL